MSKPESPGSGRTQPDIFAPSSEPGQPAHAVVDDAQRARAPEPNPATFEDALAELETIVAKMESGELTLEQSLSAYKRGAALLQYCQSALNEAQQQVKILEAGVLKEFSGTSDNGQ